MDFFFRTIQAVSSFVLGVFGVEQPIEEPVLTVDSAYEVSATATTSPEVASTTPVSEPVKPAPAAAVKTPVSGTAKVSIPLPAAPATNPSVAPTVAPTSAPARSSGSGSSSSSVQPTKLSIDGASLKKVSEKDVVKLKALLTMSDGSIKDVTSEASWEVVGPIGSIQSGSFTAKLDPSIAEFGRGPGAIHVTFKDSLTGKEFTADTGIFDVAAFIPVIETGGQ